MIRRDFPEIFLEGLMAGAGLIPVPLYSEGCDAAKVYTGNSVDNIILCGKTYIM